MKVVDHYELEDTKTLFSPALLFYKDRIVSNIQRMLEISKSPSRLRPHVKTHKTKEIAEMEVRAGITKHKCATIAEAELLAACGVADILLAYHLVGPNCRRLRQLAEAFPDCSFSTLIDHPQAAKELSAEIEKGPKSVGVFLDVDVGQHRTGIAMGDEAFDLYRRITALPGLQARGLHVYDGHNHQEDYQERAQALHQQYARVENFRRRLEEHNMGVPAIVAGGTPTFAIWAEMDVSGLECAPGTCVLHDHGYGSHFPDMTGFQPAALVFTRVISKPTANRITLDLGYKAIASDPPEQKRCVLLTDRDYSLVLQNEEHLVVEMENAQEIPVGTPFYAIPYHICPTVALHQQALVVENNKVIETWPILGRDRILTY